VQDEAFDDCCLKAQRHRAFNELVAGTQNEESVCEMAAFGPLRVDRSTLAKRVLNGNPRVSHNSSERLLSCPDLNNLRRGHPPRHRPHPTHSGQPRSLELD
jgi:hypothetical protein